MGIKDFAQKKWNWLYVALSAIAAGATIPSTVKADESRILGRLRPMQTLEETIDSREYSIRKSIGTVDEFSEDKLWGIPQKYANWYLADLLMVLYHEVGHYEEAQRQGFDPSLDLQPTVLWVNGGVSWENEDENRDDRARLAIAGFVNSGNMAEGIKKEIYLGNVAPENIRFMSMLALASELNLPFYLAQHYTGTIPDENSSDIGNFSRNTGISPETMAISSGIHMLVNAPYIYQLAKNAFGSNPEIPEAKPYFFSFRYNGDSYMINFHSDLNTIIEKIPKSRLMPLFGRN